MSMGAFVISKYEDDDGEIHPIRVQPETLALQLGSTANAAPAGAVTDNQRAKVTKGAREYGIGARTVTITFGATPPTGYRPYSYITLPVLVQATWDAITDGSAVTYQTTAGTVSYKTAERIK